MNARRNRVLLVGACLLVLGALIMAAALFSMKFDFRRLSTRKAVTNTYTPAGDFSDILVDIDTAQLSFLPAEDGKCKVVCVEEEGSQHVVTVSKNALSIQHVNTQKWYDQIGVGSGKSSVTVYLPKKEYASLTLRTSTGDVAVPAGFRFTNVVMTGSTADIDFAANVEESIGIRTSTGHIALSGLRASSLDLTASTDHIRVSDSVIAGKVSASVSTGKVSFTDMNCAEAQVKTTTGDVDLVRVLVSEQLRVQTDTGDVRFDRSDAPEIQVETDTGDVTGTLLTPKIFEAHTDTGKVKLPRSDPGGRCTLESDTGNFEIEIVG